MDLNVYARYASVGVKVIGTFPNKEDFEKYVREAVEGRSQNEEYANSCKVITIFAEGRSIARSQVKILKRALRHFDEVYLCNELFELLEELDSDVDCISLSPACSAVCTDLSNYRI